MGRLIHGGRSATIKAMPAAISQQLEDGTSRQMVPTKTNAGGISARAGSSSALRRPRTASANDGRAKPSQYDVAISRNMLPELGAIGSITPHSQVMTGDCQSP